jgi:hypothetical protein
VKYVLYKVRGHGLGNRLLVLSTAIAICRKTGAKLIIDWTDEAKTRPDFWDFFRLTGCNDILAENQSAHTLNGLPSAQESWEARYDQDVEKVFQKVTAGGAFKGMDIQAIPGISGLVSFFRGDPQDDVLVIAGYTKQGQRPDLLVKHLRFAPTVYERLRRDVSDALGGKLPQDLVGLHVRAAAGDYFSKPDYAKIARHLASPGRTLVFATDLKEEEERIRNLTKAPVIFVRKHYPSISSGNSLEPLALHKISVEHLSEMNSGLHEIIYQALLDLCLISSCSRVFYQPGSTFSELMVLFGSCYPWDARPHCFASVKTVLGGFVRASRNNAFRKTGLMSGIIPSKSKLPNFFGVSA